MSYLTQYALPDTAPRSHGGARVDLELPLNRPEFDGGASVPRTSRTRRGTSAAGDGWRSRG